MQSRFADILLSAATQFSQARNLTDLLGAVRQAIQIPSGLDQSGLGIFEERQKILVVYASTADGHSQAEASTAPLSTTGEEFPLLETEATSFATRPVTYVSPLLKLDGGMQIQRRFCQAGFRRYLSVPLIYDDRLLGALYACSRAEDPPEQEAVEHLEQLGRLLTPALWNHLTQTRLALGDRRRATLIELSDAINTSVHMGPILESARQALAQIEGHRVSIIALLREDGRSFEAYWHPSPAAQDQANATEPEVLLTKATPLPWVLERRRTFESEDVPDSSCSALKLLLSKWLYREGQCGAFFLTDGIRL